MVIDTSALTAILRKEPERDPFLRAIATSPIRLLSAVTALEAALARISGEPVLCKGEDFRQTDIPVFEAG